jgi:hypothetical protein
MSATTILVVLGGLTSSSDARAHHWVAWLAFLAQALVVMVAFLLSTLRGIRRTTRQKMNKIKICDYKRLRPFG